MQPLPKHRRAGLSACTLKITQNYTNVIPADSGSASILIPCRVSSLSTILHCIRPTANWGNNNRRSITGRCTGGLTKFSYQINGVNIPQISVPVETQTDGHGSQTQHMPVDAALVTSAGALRWDATARLWTRTTALLPEGRYGRGRISTPTKKTAVISITQSLGTFLFAVDLGSFPAEYDNVINAGLSTLTSVIMLNLEFSDEPTTQSLQTSSSFACYDSLILS